MSPPAQGSPFPFAQVPGAVNLQASDLVGDDILELANRGPLAAQTTLDQLASYLGASVINSIIAVANIAALKALPTRPDMVTTEGWATAGDGGGGPPWRWVAGSAAAADDFLVVAPTVGVAGRWIRVPITPVVSPKWAGAGLGASDDTANFQKCVDSGYSVDMSGCTCPIGSAGGTAITVGGGDSPAIFSDGSGTFTSNGVPTSSAMLSVTRSDFLLQGIVFNMPVSTIPGSPPITGQSLVTGNDARIRVIGCRFVGGTQAIHFAGAGAASTSEFWAVGNLITGTYNVAITVDFPTKIYITDNIIHDAVYNVAGASGVIRFGGILTSFICEDANISRNMIIDCLVGLPQEAIDLSSGAFRNVICADNLIVNVGNGGFELKTSGTVGVPDVYQMWSFTDNLIVMTGGIGIALNNGSGTSAPFGKAAHIVMRDNFMVAASQLLAGNGINIAGWFDVEASGNHIYNLVNGININPSGTVTPTDTGALIDLKDNVINVSTEGITFPARTVNDLFMTGNRVIAGSYPLSMGGATLTGVESKGNYWETTHATQPAFLVRDVHDAIFDGDTFVGVAAGVNSITVASTNIRFTRCDIRPGTGDAFNWAIGTVVVENCTYTVQAGHRLYVTTGGGAVVPTGNVRSGGATSNPTGTLSGAVGEVIWNSAPALGKAAWWECTTAGTNPNAIWSLGPLLGMNPGTIAFTAPSVNFNSGNTDNPITIVLPEGFSRYQVVSCVIGGASVDISAATAGLFTGAGATGVAVVTGGSAITVTATADATLNNSQAMTINNAGTESYTAGTLYFRVGTAKGAPATGSVTVHIRPLV